MLCSSAYSLHNIMSCCTLKKNIVRKFESTRKIMWYIDTKPSKARAFLSSVRHGIKSYSELNLLESLVLVFCEATIYV